MGLPDWLWETDGVWPFHASSPSLQNQRGRSHLLPHPSRWYAQMTVITSWPVPSKLSSSRNRAQSVHLLHIFGISLGRKQKEKVWELSPAFTEPVTWHSTTYKICSTVGLKPVSRQFRVCNLYLQKLYGHYWLAGTSPSFQLFNFNCSQIPSLKLSIKNSF